MTTYGNFDDGNSGQPNGSLGRWLSWHVQGNSTIPPCSWSLRDTAGPYEVTEAPGTQFVFDLTSLRTGWERNSGQAGVAPERQWNASIARFEAQPGDGWKRAFTVTVVFSQDEPAIWQQAGFSSWAALTDIMRLVGPEADARAPLLPVLRCTGHRTIKTRHGGTEAPTFALLRWVPRPSVLNAAATTAFDSGESAPKTVQRTAPKADWYAGNGAARAQRPPAPPPAKMLDDEIPF